jgi:hypothetical protein
MINDELAPWNPDPAAEARVKNVLPAPRFCPHCEDEVGIITMKFMAQPLVTGRGYSFAGRVTLA